MTGRVAMSAAAARARTGQIFPWGNPATTTTAFSGAMRVPRPEEWSPRREAPRADLRAPAPAVASGAALGLSQESDVLVTRSPVAPSDAPSVSAGVSVDARVAEADAIWVTIVEPSALFRGQLAQVLDQQIEQRLSACGAPGRTVWTGRGLAERLQDQVYRARLLGSQGLALALSPLDHISEDGALDSADSGTLCWWLQSAPAFGVRLFVPESLYDLKVFTSPVGLRTLLDANKDRARSVRGRVGSDAATGQIQLPFDTGLRAELRLLPTPDNSGANRVADEDTQGGIAEELLDDQDELSPLVEAPEDSKPQEASSRILTGPVSGPRASRAPQPNAAPVVADATHLHAWRASLETASGVQTWADLERQFVASYLPLSCAVQRGEGTARDQAALTRWADNFAASYSEAYLRLCRFSRRPEMIFDLPKIAFQLARQEQAIQTRLVMVDGLRFDIGQRAHDKLRLQLTGLGRCVSRGVLWSALPTETAVQLELLARGPDGLRSALPDDEVEGLVAKGGAARKLRPLRAGPHHLLKLDCVQSQLTECRSFGDAEVEEAAANVATTVGRFLSQQAPQTLLVLFGDHGFSFKDGSTGGARPEQVLVPYDAWLLDERP